MNRLQMARRIIDWEARRDSDGHLKAYKLPANDGGGEWEVAGINDRYHPEMTRRLRDMLAAGRYDEAEAQASEYIARYTDVVAGWSTIPAVEFFLRDSCFNRGPGGAAKIAQMAVKTTADGIVGPITRAAIKAAEANPVLLLIRLRLARERYENIVAPGRANLRVGLENRWDNAVETSADLLVA